MLKQPYYQENEIGKKRTDLLLLLKIYFPQQWFNLSGPADEEVIYDRVSFQKFLNIDLMDNIPDERLFLTLGTYSKNINCRKTFMNKIVAICFFFFLNLFNRLFPLFKRQGFEKLNDVSETEIRNRKQGIFK